MNCENITITDASADDLLERATNKGVERVVLLTSMASDFFARRFGFSETLRIVFDKELAASSEWNLPRCSSAICMSLDLRERAKHDPTRSRDHCVSNRANRIVSPSRS